MISFYRLKAIAWKESIQILRDPRSIAIVVLMPVILMFAFGYGINFDVKHVPAFVYDQDGTQYSQDFLKQFQASEYFAIVKNVSNYRELVNGIDKGECAVAIVVPTRFAEDLRSGRPTRIQAILDATDANTANVAMGYIDGITRAYSAKIAVDWTSSQGQQPLQARVNVASRTWFNEDLESMANVVPGVVAIVMAVVGTFLTALTIAREWERGTMEQLIATPITPLELMLGKLFPYFIIGLADTVLCALLGVYWFKVPFRGEPWVFVLSSTLFLITVLSLGYVLSVAMKSQLAASQASLVATFLPAFLLSGFIFSIDQMPRPVQFITIIIPARYFMTLIRAVFLKGTPVVLLWVDLLSLMIFATVLVFIATRAFKKQLG